MVDQHDNYSLFIVLSNVNINISGRKKTKEMIENSMQKIAHRRKRNKVRSKIESWVSLTHSSSSSRLGHKAIAKKLLKVAM